MFLTQMLHYIFIVSKHACLQKNTLHKPEARRYLHSRFVLCVSARTICSRFYFIFPNATSWSPPFRRLVKYNGDSYV